MIDPKRVFELMQTNIADVCEMLSNNERLTICIDKRGFVSISSAHDMQNGIKERMSYSVSEDDEE